MSNASRFSPLVSAFLVSAILIPAFVVGGAAAAHAVLTPKPPANFSNSPILCYEQFLPYNPNTQWVDSNVFIGEVDPKDADKWKTEPVFLGVSSYGGDVSCFHFSDFFYRNRANLNRARCEVKVLGDSEDPYAVAHMSVGPQRDFLYLGTGSVAEVQARAEHEQETCERVLNFVKSVLAEKAISN